MHDPQPHNVMHATRRSHEETQQCLDFLVILTTPMVANRTQQRFE